MKTPTVMFVCLSLFTLSACQSSETTSEPEASTPDGTSSEPVEPLAEELCEETDRELIVPWMGPGVSADGELLELDDSKQYVLHSTWAVAAPGQESEFLSLAVAVIGALQDIPGLVAVTASRSEACGGLRTLGVWESQEAMFQMLATPAHVEAVGRAAEVSTIGKTTSWMGTAAEARALDWDAGRDKLLEVPASPAYD